MKITYFGQSCFLLETAAHRVLIDPMISINPLAKHIKVDEIECDTILVTHAHFDHVVDVFSIALRNDALLVSNYEIVEYFKSKGIVKTHPMNIGGTWSFDFGKLRMVYAAHSSSFADGSYGGTASGYILEVEGKRLYIAGDTGLTMEMKLIGDLYPPDIAILPIGGNYTMNAEDALHASHFIDCSHIIACHFDTVPEIEIDKEAANNLFKQASKELKFLNIGESYPI